jgi:hypothetical protein
MKIIFIILFVCSVVYAKDEKVEHKKVIYTYKQYEKFDFDDLDIDANAGAPNDLSVSPGHEKRYANRLPYRKTFTTEIRKGIERVR